MSRDSGAALLRRLTIAGRERLLAAMPRDASTALAQLTRFPEGTAGALMDPEVFSVPADAPVHAALNEIRTSGARVLYYVYVVDRGNRLTGVVNLRELMFADPDAILRDVMRPQVERISVYADRGAALTHPAWRTFYALPVVDDLGLLVGFLRHKRLHTPEDETPAESSSLLAVGISLGEMYWSVTGQLLQSLWSPSVAPPITATTETGSNTDTEKNNDQ
jgi:Mg/Co/Ni transporter MgtE